MTLQLNRQVLPSSWQWVAIGQIAEIVTGTTPSKQNPANYGSYLPFVKPGDLDTTHPITYSAEYLSEQGTHFARVIPSNSIMVTCIGATIGKTGISGTVVATNQQINSFSLSGDLVPKLAYYYCLSSACQEWIKANASSTTLPILNKSKFSNLPFPLAPLNEQHRIVAAIETQFTRLDVAVTALKRSQANLKRYRSAVLKAACEGRLVPTDAELAQAEGRSYEPASVLLERILAERRHKWEAENPKKKYQEPVAPDTSALSELPEGWVWTTIDQLASPEERSIQSGPFGSALLHSEFQSDGILAIGIDNVLAGRFSLGRQHRISETKYKELAKFTARPLDVLITVMATLGRTCVLPAEIERAIITKHVYRITVNQEFCSPNYLMCSVWGAESVLVQLSEQAQGQTRPGINGAILKRLAIPIPPLAEQHRIVAEVERRLSLIDQLEKTIEADLVRANRLRQSILKRAFAGQLVPQDPNDEPASVLLERIKAAKDGQPVQKEFPLSL